MGCTRLTVMQTASLVRKGHGRIPLAELLPRLKCRHCGQRARNVTALDDYGDGEAWKNGPALSVQVWPCPNCSPVPVCRPSRSRPLARRQPLRPTLPRDRLEQALACERAQAQPLALGCGYCVRVLARRHAIRDALSRARVGAGLGAWDACAVGGWRLILWHVAALPLWSTS
jgi:hypothetical protein